MTQQDDDSFEAMVSGMQNRLTESTDRAVAAAEVHLEYVRKAREEIRAGQRAENPVQIRNGKRNLANAAAVKAYVEETGAENPRAVYEAVEASGWPADGRLSIELAKEEYAKTQAPRTPAERLDPHDPEWRRNLRQRGEERRQEIRQMTRDVVDAARRELGIVIQDPPSSRGR